jgi:hypothetical protein
VRPADGFDIQFKKKKKDKIGKKDETLIFPTRPVEWNKSFSQSEDKNNF